MQDLLGRWAGPLCILGLWALFFASHLLGEGMPYYRDSLVTLLPIRHFLHERLLAGELPEWYPYEGLGVPFIGQIVTATFHPQTLLFLPLEPAAALKLNLLAGYLLGASGAYATCRALEASRSAAVAGASAFAFGGYALGVSHNLVYLMGHATLPWVACAALRLAAHRRPSDAAFLMLAWALVFLAGDAQLFGLCPLVLIAAMAAKSEGWRASTLMAVSAIGAVLLIGVELLPALAVSRESIRGLGTASPTLGLTWALHPLRIAELLIPGFVPDAYRNRMVAEVLGGGGAVWSTTVFAGALALLLAAVGLASGRRSALAFGAVCLLGLWLALGDRGGLLPVARTLLPPLSKFRFPEKYLTLFWMGLAPLVALGADRVTARPRPAAIAAAAGGLACAALAWLAWRGVLVSAVWEARGSTLLDGEGLRAAVQSAWSAGLLWSAAFLLVGAGLVWLARKRPGLSKLLPLLLFAELLHGNGAHLPLVPAAVLDEPNVFAAHARTTARDDAPPERVTGLARSSVPLTVTLGDGETWVRSMRHAFHLDTHGPDAVAAFGTNLPATPARYGLLLGATPREAAAWAPHFNGCLWGVSLDGPIPAGLQWVSRNEALRLGLARGACLPRAYLAGAQPASGMQQALQRMRRGLPSGVAVVEGASALAPVQGQVQWVSAAPERLQLFTRAAQPAVLVVSDQWTRGWSATLDGEPVPLLPANVAARAVQLPPGEHAVELSYRTPLLGVGAALSVAGCLLLLLLLLGSRARSPSHPPGSGAA